MISHPIHPYDPSNDDGGKHALGGLCASCYLPLGDPCHDPMRRLRCSGRPVNNDGAAYGPECGVTIEAADGVTVSRFRSDARALGWRIVGEGPIAACPACMRPTAEHQANVAALRRMVQP